MKTLFLHGRTKQGRALGFLSGGWMPKSWAGCFVYTRGALRAQEEAGLEPLDSFPEFNKSYESDELFPLFKNRVLDPNRQDFGQYLKQLGLSADMADPIEILSVSGGERQTDNLEVFPKMVRRDDGGFRCRFFLHGWRYVSQSAQTRLDSLRPNDPLRVAIELNNPATRLALQLQSADDYHVLGWTPRYLVQDLVRVIVEAPGDIDAKVVRVNPIPAPAKQRVLIELSGRWPASYEPMSTEDFRPLQLH